MINNAGALKLVGVPTGSPSSVQLVDASTIAGYSRPLIITTNKTAAELLPFSPVIAEPASTLTIDVPGSGANAWDLTQSRTIRIDKDTRALFQIVLNVTTNGGGLWTTPNGLNQDYVLPASSEQLCGAWDVLIDGPTRTIRVTSYPRGVLEIMIAAPTAGPGDTLDLFAGGTFVGHTITGAGGASTVQIGAPRSDGVAFINAGVANVRRLQDLGLGAGQRLLMEQARTNLLLQSESLYTGAVITAPWAAIGATTGLGGQAGSPRGDATSTNVVFAGAGDGIAQPFTLAAQNSCVGSVWVRCLAGVESCRLQMLLKDGSTVTSTDYAITPTWRRLDLSIPNIGPNTSSGTPEFRLLNGSDGLARTVQVWGAQLEGGFGILYPTSYIKTVAVTVVRSTDALAYAPAAVPASFRTRGMSLSFAPAGTNLEFFLSGMYLVAWDTDDVSPTGSAIDYLRLNGSLSGVPAALGAAHLSMGALSSGYPVAPTSFPGCPRSMSEPLTFNRDQVLTLAGEAYRGALRVQGATTGDGRYSVGGGPWTWPTFSSLNIGSTVLLAATGSGTFGQFITSA